MFSETNYMEQDSKKDCLALVKTIVFLNMYFPCKTYAVHNKNIKAQVRIITRHYVSYAFNTKSKSIPKY